ncbi:Long-chain fatty acid transport protein [Fodinibius salinus]|uniref:Long-chain fatty acid transport protein n=2 Tax=Fodinibius salinus TaxID=860790 RepID=A0A5D3YRB8_9BACT|nr:Long-chain fatty acid transport protein [Fodinibius salinus]
MNFPATTRSMCKKSIIAFALLFVLAGVLNAQTADDVLRYSLEYPSYDPVSLVMPGVSDAAGLGGFQANPATMALLKDSYLSLGLSSRFLDESSTYLGNTSQYSDNQTSIGDAMLAYKIPTARGSLVIGGGFSQTTDFNRALSGSGRNNESTITDFYNSSFADDSLFFAAFDVYAIDFAATDSSFANTKSIFRFFSNPNSYPGINQDFELTERGRMGEYSAFIATEFSKNFFVGASVGYLSGSYSYRRNFLESDRQNDYDAQFIDTDGDGNFETDIESIESIDTIDGDIRAFSARIGFVFKPVEQLSIGGAYEFPSTLHIDEEYNTSLRTTFDNGVVFEDDAPGAFSYKITRPRRINGGATVALANSVTLSASAEAVFYSDARIEFDDLNLNPQENGINNVVRSNFRDVINLRGGIEYAINERFTPRIGYAYFPSPQKNLNRDRQFINGGFSAIITKGLMFDFGLQYSFWKDQNTLYQTPSTREVATEEVTRINVMAGFKMAL